MSEKALEVAVFPRGVWVVWSDPSEGQLKGVICRIPLSELSDAVDNLVLNDEFASGIGDAAT